MRGLYIHIPFCIRKCRYCDFVSYCGSLGETETYIDALIKEMHEFHGGEVDTIFIGGGTPTVLDNVHIEKLCKAVFDNFNVKSGCEFSVEANPGTIDFDKAHLLRSCGVNRISVGVQSFNDDELKCLGRIHSAKEAYDTVNDIHRAGFDNISIDIMTALPNQTKQKLINTVKTATELPIKHISAYSLILEDGTPLTRDYEKGLFEIPSEDEDREMYELTVRTLEKHGFKRYEISNFAMDGFECEHNKRYWECREYYGLGAAAHSYMNGKRIENTSNLNEYISGKYHSGETVLTKDDMIFEFVMMGMRMDKGINENEFERRFGIKAQTLYKKQLDKFINGGFIEKTDGNIRFTDKGRDVSNSILCEFIL